MVSSRISLYVVTVIIIDNPNTMDSIISPVKYIGLSFIAAAMSITIAQTDMTSDKINESGSIFNLLFYD